MKINTVQITTIKLAISKNWQESFRLLCTAYFSIVSHSTHYTPFRAGNVIAEKITTPPFPTRRFPVSVNMVNHPLVMQAKLGDTLTVTLSKDICGSLTVRDFTMTVVYKN